MRAVNAVGRDSWTATYAFALAAIALGQAVQPAGQPIPLACFGWLTLAVAATVFGIGRWRIEALERVGERGVIGLIAVALAAQFSELLTAQPGTSILPGVDFVPYVTGLLAAVVLAGIALSPSATGRRMAIPVLLATYFLIGIWIIAAAPDPFIDVFVFQYEASQALLAGLNPYAITYTDIHGPGSGLYGPGLSDGFRTTFGFVYPPLSLILAVPGYLLGDLRYAHLAATTAAGALIAYTRPSRVAAAAAALFLFTPRSLHVVEQSWTEPFAVLLLAATVFLVVRRPQLAYLAFGLFLAAKQHLVLAVPLALLLVRRRATVSAVRGFIAPAGVVALAVTLPFAVWDVHAFLDALVEVPLRQPFRIDSLSYSALVALTTGAELPAVLGFVAAFAATALVLVRAPRTASAFAGGTALVFSVFFAFGKQAHTNYWFFVIGALCCAVAATQLSGTHRGADAREQAR